MSSTEHNSRQLGVVKHIHTVRLTAHNQIEVRILDECAVTISPKEAVDLSKSLKRVAKPRVLRGAS